MFQCNLSKYAGYFPASAASIDFHLNHPGGAETVPAKLSDKFNWESLTINAHLILLFLSLLWNATGLHVYEAKQRNWLMLTIKP